MVNIDSESDLVNDDISGKDNSYIGRNLVFANNLMFGHCGVGMTKYGNGTSVGKLIEFPIMAMSFRLAIH